MELLELDLRFIIVVCTKIPREVVLPIRVLFCLRVTSRMNSLEIYNDVLFTQYQYQIHFKFVLSYQPVVSLSFMYVRRPKCHISMILHGIYTSKTILVTK